MHQYIGTKLIRAQAMSRAEYNDYRGWELPANESGDDLGFLVEYLDGGQSNHPNHSGYISWSPADVFSRAYRPATGLTFGMALEALKLGERVARAGWNGAGQFVYLVLVSAASYPAQTGAAKAHFGPDAMVPYNAYMAIKNVNETVSAWVPSVNDCLVEDWEIVK